MILGKGLTQVVRRLPALNSAPIYIYIFICIFSLIHDVNVPPGREDGGFHADFPLVAQLVKVVTTSISILHALSFSPPLFFCVCHFIVVPLLLP